MNIHEAVVGDNRCIYCNRQAATDRRRQAKDGNFHAPVGACATERALNSAHGRSSAKTILLHFMMVRWPVSVIRKNGKENRTYEINFVVRI